METPYSTRGRIRSGLATAAAAGRRAVAAALLLVAVAAALLLVAVGVPLVAAPALLSRSIQPRPAGGKTPTAAAPSIAARLAAVVRGRLTTKNATA